MSGFYRARIIEALDSNLVRVQYLDFGGHMEDVEVTKLSILIEKSFPPTFHQSHQTQVKHVDLDKDENSNYISPQSKSEVTHDISSQTATDVRDISPQIKIGDISPQMAKDARDLSPQMAEVVRDISPQMAKAARDISPQMTKAARHLSPQTAKASRDISPQMAKAAHDISPQMAKAPRDISPQMAKVARDLSPQIKIRDGQVILDDVSSRLTKLQHETNDTYDVLSEDAFSSPRKIEVHNTSPQTRTNITNITYDHIPQVKQFIQNEETTVRPSNSPTTAESETYREPELLDDPIIADWIKEELANVPYGVWAVRLAHSFKEKFEKVLDEEVIKQLQFRPDIARVEEPIEGRYLFYCSKGKQVGKAVPKYRKGSA